MVLDPEKAIDCVDGQMVARSNDAWFRVTNPADLNRLRWVRFRYISSYFDDPTRPLIRFTTSLGKSYLQPMNGPVLGRGEWIGRIPGNTVDVSISPVSKEGAFDFRLESIRRVPRRWLLRRGMAIDRTALWMSVGAKIINAEEERWNTLKFAATATLLRHYDHWHEHLWRRIDIKGIDRPRADWSRTPVIRLFVALELGNQLGLNATLASLREQVYGRWTLHGVVSETTPPDVLAAFRREAAGDTRLREVDRTAATAEVFSDFGADDMVGIMGFGDGLPDHALAVVVERIFREPWLRIVYGDEDALSTKGVLHSPVFKPDWSPLLFDKTPFLGRLTCVRAADLARLDCGTAGDLIDQETPVLKSLAAAVKPSEIGHIRRILYRRWRDQDVEPLRESPTAIANAEAATANDQPEVSIVIPTRDRAALLAPCVKSLRELTDYPRFNIVIVDNGSSEADAVALLRELGSEPNVRIIDSPGPFNFSALCNEGARATTAPVIVFLNNDTIIFDKDWLAALVKYAVRPDVGVVGAKLLFPDNRIEHAGVVLGHGGIAGHLYHRHAAVEPGYMGHLRVAHEVAAVTGACIAIERKKFEAVGGFDPENLPVDLNDIDLCLRISEKGWATVWTPEAVLYHLQSASRGFQFKPTKVYRKERDYFLKQWPHVVRDDPFFHPALSLYSHKPALA